MATKTAADLVGLTLYAKNRVPLLRWGKDDAPVLRYVEPGQRIGIIRSWTSRKPGSLFWYWEFDDSSRGELSTFYVPHIPGLINMPQLREDMQERDEALRRRRLQWYERLVEDGTNVIQAGTSQLYTGAFLLVGLYLVTRAVAK